ETNLGPVRHSCRPSRRREHCPHRGDCRPGGCSDVRGRARAPLRRQLRRNRNRHRRDRVKRRCDGRARHPGLGRRAAAARARPPGRHPRGVRCAPRRGDGSKTRGRAPSRPQARAGQQPAAPRDRRGAGRADPARARSRQAARGGGGGVQVAQRRRAPGAADRARARKRSPHQARPDRGQGRDHSALRRPARVGPTHGGLRHRRPGRRRRPGPAARPPGGRAGAIARDRENLGRRDREPARPPRPPPERLLRRLARVGAAARGDRARGHLRGHGHHQHGPWRDGHARRLHHFCGAGGDPRPLARAVRPLARHRPAARLSGRGRRRRADRAQRDPLPLWPAPRNAARDLGRVAHPAAGRALDVRAEQPRGRQPGLHVRLLRPLRHRADLEPPLDRGVLACGIRGAPARAEIHGLWAAHARRRAEPAHGGLDGHPHELDRRHDLWARLRHCRHRRGRAVADRQRLAQSRAELHHRQLHGGGLRRRRQSLGHARGRADAGHCEQAARTFCGRGVGQDPGPRRHHPLHPEAAAGAVRAEGQGGGGV
ncbi:MAG: Urea ABC transporter, permease protein UrtB, partial [uncultured Microvirga sp.]